MKNTLLVLVLTLASAGNCGAQEANPFPKAVHRPNEPDQAINYSRIASQAEWTGEKNQSLLSCFGALFKYRARLETTTDRLKLIFTLIDLNDESEIFSWEGHYASVFLVKEDILFFANFSSVGTGGEIVAVNLSKGKEIWCEKLKALGDISHMAYSNKIQIEHRQNAIWVWGNESFGKYLELKDMKTGKTIAHRVFGGQ